MILKLTNNSVFGKAMKNVRNQREREILSLQQQIKE